MSSDRSISSYSSFSRNLEMWQVIDRSGDQTPTDDETALLQVLERSRSENGSERATMLAIELSQNDQALNKALELSKREQQERAVFESALAEVKHMSLQTYQSEEVWAIAQRTAQEESRRAYEEEVDRRNRLWEHELLSGSPACSTSSSFESNYTPADLEEGYNSGDFQSGGSTPRPTDSTIPHATPQKLAFAHHITWQFPTAQNISSTSSGDIMSRIRSSPKLSTHSADSMVEDMIHSSLLPLFIAAPYAPTPQHPSAPQHSLQVLRAPTTSKDNGRSSFWSDSASNDVYFCHTESNKSQSAVSPHVLIHNHSCPSLEAPGEHDYTQAPEMPATPQVIHHEHHHHGDIYHQSIQNFVRGDKKRFHESNSQKKESRHSNAGVAGLYQRAEKTRSPKLPPSTGHSKKGLSFLRDLSNKILSNHAPPLSEQDCGSREDDERSQFRQTLSSSNPDLDNHFCNTYEHMNMTPRCKLADYESQIPVNRKEHPEPQRGVLMHNEPLYAPLTPSVDSDNTYRTRPDLASPNSVRNYETPFYTAPTSPKSVAHSEKIDGRGQFKASDLVKRLEREAVREPFVPGAYPESLSSSTSRASSVLHVNSVLTCATDGPRTTPLVPPKISISNSPKRPDLPELTVPGAFPTSFSPPTLNLAGPEIPLESALPLRSPLQRPPSPASMVSQVSMIVHSPTPQRLRAELGRSFTYRPLDVNLPLVPGPDQDFKTLGNHAMRDLDRHGGGGKMPVKAPVLPKLPQDHARDDR